jgi:hypothetical protein
MAAGSIFDTPLVETLILTHIHEGEAIARYGRIFNQKEMVQSPNVTVTFAEFWFRAFLASESWHGQPNIRRILNVICRAVFFISGGRFMVHEQLKGQYRWLQVHEQDKKRGFVASFKSFFAAAVDPVVILSIADAGKVFICAIKKH